MSTAYDDCRLIPSQHKMMSFSHTIGYQFGTALNWRRFVITNSRAGSTMFKSDNILALEKPLMTVPHEQLRKNFKSMQRNIEKEAAYLNSALQQLSNGSGDAAAAAAKLDELTQRVRDLKRRLQASKREHNTQVANVRDRMKYITETTIAAEEYAKLEKQGASRDDRLRTASAVGIADGVPDFSWTKKRLDMLLVDYCLRQGYIDSAKQYAAAKGIESLVDVPIVAQCGEICNALRQHNVGPCLAWCHENKVQLKKLRSDLEFEIRLQQFVELIRDGQQEEAVKYAKKHFPRNAPTHVNAMMQASILLAYPPGSLNDLKLKANEPKSVAEKTALSKIEQHIDSYLALYSGDRWNHLEELFIEIFYEINGTQTEPPLYAALATGISAMKTRSCIHGVNDPKKDWHPLTRAHMCPVCSNELAPLAKELPFALHTKCDLASDPVLLKNGNVYGFQDLVRYSEAAMVGEDLLGYTETGLGRGDFVKDPRTGELTQKIAVQSVYPS